MATLSLPATGLGGTTETISGSGTLSLGISLSAEGTISTTVVAGSNAASDTSNIAPTDTGSFNGFYHITCEDSKNSDAKAKAMCKCMFGDTSFYNSNNGGGQEACMDDHAAHVTSVTGQDIDVNVYSAIVNSDMVENGKKMLVSGSTVQGVTVWGANCNGNTCTSARGSGGEGLTDFGGKITWNGTNSTTATTAIQWATGSQSMSFRTQNGSATQSITIGTIPSHTASPSDWLTWVQAMMPTQGDSNHWQCHPWDNSVTLAQNDTISGRADCVAQFINEFLNHGADGGGNVILPRVHYDAPPCDHNGCTMTSPANGRIFVEGIEFDYSQQKNISNGTLKAEHSNGASPSQRMVFEKWQPFANGGGTFTQKNHEKRRFSCSSSQGNEDLTHAACTHNHDSVECFIRRELTIVFKPTGTTGVMNIGFNNTSTVMQGFFTGGNGMNQNQAYELCKDQLGASGGAFMAAGTKH